MKSFKIIGLLLFINIGSIIMGKEFRILTYNIYGARLSNGIKLGESIKRYNPDVVSLQEVDMMTNRSSFRNVTQDIARELGYSYYYFQKARNFDSGEFGISIISKHPVEKVYTYELPSIGVEKRQMLGIKLMPEAFGKSIMVINSHMDYKNEIKTREINDFLSVTNAFEGDIKFISGDFNLLPTSEHYEKLSKEWIDSYFGTEEMLKNEQKKEQYKDRNIYIPRIDYIMGDKSDNWVLKDSYFINDNTQDWTRLSDHLPYLGIFEIK